MAHFIDIKSNWDLVINLLTRAYKLTKMYLTRRDWLQILENALAYIIVLAMLAYGVGKLVQFKHAQHVSTPVSELSGMQLMWAFYGYSRPFVLTLGVLEIIGGLLVLVKRYRLIGCLLVSTILINVILQDIFYNVNIGALRAAILYQIAIFIIFILNKQIVIGVWKKLIQANVNHDDLKKKLYILLVSVMLFVLLRIIEYYITIRW